MEYDSAAEKHEIMSFAGKWMKMEIMMVSEISPAQRARYHMFSLICELDLK
jgi:hypothetical protein